MEANVTGGGSTGAVGFATFGAVVGEEGGATTGAEVASDLVAWAAW